MNKADLRKWWDEKGDYTHRLNYTLDENSIVFDVGGYEGWFAKHIYDKFKCTVHVFEPVKIFYDKILNRFKDNHNIIVHCMGLSNSTRNEEIFLNKDATSVYSKQGTPEIISLVSIAEFMHLHNIDHVDLLKLNIEGEEFPLLDFIIKNNITNSFTDIQVQFHQFIEDSINKRNEIRASLALTHNLTYDFEFIWENWSRI